MLSDTVAMGERIPIAKPYDRQPSNDSANAPKTLKKICAQRLGNCRLCPEQRRDRVSFTHGKTAVVGYHQSIDVLRISLVCYSHLKSGKEFAGEPEYIDYDSGEGALYKLQREASEILAAGSIHQEIDRMGEIIVFKKSAHP
jgi:hypothetical protein